MAQQLDWPRYSRWTWTIAALAVAVLIWLWLTGRGPVASAGCCGAPVAAIPAVSAPTALPALPALPALSASAPVATAPLATPPAEPVAAVPAVRAQDVQCSDKIALAATFATGSARLTADARKLLTAVVPCIVGPYEVAGHTDNVGQPAANLALSARRAQAVVAYLALQGVDAKLLSPKGYGDTAPISDNATVAGQAANRRIEFKK